MVKKTLKYFTGFNDDDKQVKCFDNSKTMSFIAIDEGLYVNKCEITSSLMSMKFDSEPVYGDNNKHIKTKIKSQGDKVNTKLR